MISQRTFTLLCPFGGLGAGARGFLDASVDLCDTRGEFHLLGSIDFDAVACADAELLTGRPAWCVDVRTITPAQLVQRHGRRGPDVVFASPPCQGASRLLSEAKSREQKYEDLNQLTLVWLDVMLEAWGDHPPRLVLIENVPGLPKRAASMLKAARKKLRAHGYVFTDGTHDCGEIGGLAQHRKRYLLVARHAKSCPPLLYQPPVKRVRGVGEVLEQLPMPATLAAQEWGAMHTMPKPSWRNWLRLALIPAGGDWRDLAGVLGERARREVFRRHAVQKWTEPHPAVTGPGGHSVEAVSDARVQLGCAPHAGAYGLVEGVRVLTLDEAMALDLDPGKAPPFIPVIIAEDSTWHRPMTLLELAALQGLPLRIGDKPLRLSGTRTQQATHIGNAVPVGAARAIAERMLVALLEADGAGWSLGGDTPVWVDGPGVEATC